MWPVTASTYAATGEPGHTTVIGRARNIKAAEIIAREDYEKELGGYRPTGWEHSYGWGSCFFDFKDEYMHLPPRPSTARVVDRSVERTPRHIDEPFVLSEEEETIEKLDRDFETYKLITALINHKYSGVVQANASALAIMRLDADTLCNLMGVKPFQDIYFSERMGHVVLEVPHDA